MAKIFIDTEFNSTSEPNLNVVCVAWQIDDGPIESLWLQDDYGLATFKDLFESWVEQELTFVAFYAVAEMRALLSIGLDPERVRWVDLWIEYRMLLNHNHVLECGNQLIKGEVKRVKIPVPKWDREDDWSSGGKAELSMSAAVYKLLGVKIDTDRKDSTRDLIINNMSWTLEEEMDILAYCESDIMYLPQLFKKIYAILRAKYEQHHRGAVNEEILKRGDYALATAKMEQVGYPLDIEATRSFSDSVSDILFEMQCAVGRDFPVENPFLKHNTRDLHVQKKEKLQNWVQSQNHTGWTLTDKSQISLNVDAFEKFYSRSGDQSNFGNRFLKYLYDKKTLNGFSAPSKKKKTIWEFVGSDGRVRPWFGIFRAQSSRSQPSATSYILLKSKWMRVLLQPKPGRCIVAVDYAQQEFLIAAILSQDKNMLEAYDSSCPYFHTAKLAGAVPMDAERKNFESIRDKFKSTVLGIQYLMGAAGLATKLTSDLGIEHTEDEAQELIDLFQESYQDFKNYRDGIWFDYNDVGYVRLNDGWTMWGDNFNRRSVCNMPIQGAGAAIMRAAVIDAQGYGLDVIMTLHDAVYVECLTSDWSESLELLAHCMKEAFRKYFHTYPNFIDCRMDPLVWGQDFDDRLAPNPLGGDDFKLMSKYIVKKAVADHQKYSKYFIPREEIDLLIRL